VLRDKQRAAERGAQRRLRRPTATRRHEEAILKDIVELADCYDTPIRTALRLSIPHPRMPSCDRRALDVMIWS
jgi:hypothetical protein